MSWTWTTINIQPMKRFIFLSIILAILAAPLHAQPPKVPQYMEFAGQTVHFNTTDRYEKMDRELLTFAYMHSTSTLMLKRSGRYFPQVEPILKEFGLPDDLKYLMVIESNLDPSAVSSAGAAGLWQLMPATAREYGLEVNANVDERYNVEKCTRAACKYLKSAYDKFGDWMNVAASYNAGQGGISSRLDSQQQSSALELWLNTETSRYMYRLLAAKMMFQNPLSFGFNVTEGDKYKYYPPEQVITVTDPIPDLVAFAARYAVTYAELKRANLWLREAKLNNSSHRTYLIVISKD